MMDQRLTIESFVRRVKLDPLCIYYWTRFTVNSSHILRTKHLRVRSQQLSEVRIPIARKTEGICRTCASANDVVHVHRSGHVDVGGRNG